MVRSPTLSVSSTVKPLTFITTAFPSSTHLTFPVSTTTPQPQILQSSHLQHQQCKARLSSLVCSAQTAISRRGQDSYDPELRLVLELATDSELYNLERILFGPSYFSPLLKSITNRVDEIDFIMIGEDYEERQYFIELLEDRFFYLAADARFTLRGWRPTYRDTLLGVRRKLRIPCSSKLSTEDLEVEIFLHLLQDYSSGEADDPLENSSTSISRDGLEYGLSQMKVHAVAALKGGAAELKSIVLKGGGIVTLAKIYQMQGHYLGRCYQKLPTIR